MIVTPVFSLQRHAADAPLEQARSRPRLGARERARRAVTAAAPAAAGAAVRDVRVVARRLHRVELGDRG